MSNNRLTFLAKKKKKNTKEALLPIGTITREMIKLSEMMKKP